MMRIVAVMLLMALAVCCFSGCEGEWSSTIPDDMSGAERGHREDFTAYKLRNISGEVSIDAENNQLIFKAISDGYEGLDYFNCVIEVKMSCTVLYEDMTEENFSRSIVLKLPYNGSVSESKTVELEKAPHEVYEMPSETFVKGGQVIKK